MTYSDPLTTNNAIYHGSLTLTIKLNEFNQTTCFVIYAYADGYH